MWYLYKYINKQYFPYIILVFIIVFITTEITWVILYFKFNVHNLYLLNVKFSYEFIYTKIYYYIKIIITKFNA